MKTGTLRHVKTLRLKRRLDNAADYVVAGVLNCLWDMTAEQAPRGDVGRFTDEDIAAYIGWTGDESELVEALVASGWLDRCEEHRLVVHDWPEHAPKFIKDRLRKRNEEFAKVKTERHRRSKTGESSVGDAPKGGSPRKSSVSDAIGSERSHINGTQRNATERNATEPNVVEPGSAAPPAAHAPACSPSEGPGLPFSVKGGKSSTWRLSDVIQAEHVASFPQLDVPAVLARMQRWCEANPAKRKTSRGMHRFILSWLERDADEAGAKPDEEAAMQQFEDDKRILAAAMRGETAEDTDGAIDVTPLRLEGGNDANADRF